MTMQDKTTGRRPSNDPMEPNDVRAKDTKVPRDFPDEDVTKGSVVESKKRNENMETLENADRDVGGGSDLEKSGGNLGEQQLGSQPSRPTADRPKGQGGSPQNPGSQTGGPQKPSGQR